MSKPARTLLVDYYQLPKNVVLIVKLRGADAN